MHQDGPGSDGFNLIVSLSDITAHTRIYTRYNGDDYDIETCDGGFGSATYFSMDTHHAAPHVPGRVVMAVRWKFDGVIPDELERAAAFDANTWVDPGPSPEPTHACIQNFLSQTDIAAIKASGIRSEGAMLVLRRAVETFCDYMWKRRADGRRSTACVDREIVTGQPFEHQSSPTTIGSFRVISVSLSDENGKHHQAYKFDQFGSKKTESDSCFGGFGSAIMIPYNVSVSNPTGPDRVFFQCRVIYTNGGFMPKPRFTTEEKALAESYEA